MHQVRPLSWLLGESHTAAEQTIEPWRPVRAAVVGVCALVLAYAGHLVAGGVPVGVLPLVVPASVTMAGSWALSRRSFTMVPLLAVLVMAQLVLHGWFAFTAGTSLGATMGPSTMARMTATNPVAMVLAHALAAVLTSVLLRQGDRALLSIVVTLVRRLFVHVVESVSVAVGGSPAPARASAGWPLRALVLASGQPLRGPPAHRVP